MNSFGEMIYPKFLEEAETRWYDSNYLFLISAEVDWVIVSPVLYRPQSRWDSDVVNELVERLYESLQKGMR